MNVYAPILSTYEDGLDQMQKEDQNLEQEGKLFPKGDIILCLVYFYAKMGKKNYIKQIADKLT